jgi:hypothetical protein
MGSRKLRLASIGDSHELAHRVSASRWRQRLRASRRARNHRLVCARGGSSGASGSSSPDWPGAIRLTSSSSIRICSIRSSSIRSSSRQRCIVPTELCAQRGCEPPMRQQDRMRLRPSVRLRRSVRLPVDKLLEERRCQLRLGHRKREG